MDETMPPLPGLSLVNGKTVTARFDGGALSSNAGLLALREVERRLDVAGRLGACIDDPRDPARTTVHGVADIRLVYLPPYTPELQPAETLWAHLDEPIVNKHFDTLAELDAVVAERCISPSKKTATSSEARPNSTGGRRRAIPT